MWAVKKVNASRMSIKIGIQINRLNRICNKPTTQLSRLRAHAGSDTHLHICSLIRIRIGIHVHIRIRPYDAFPSSNINTETATDCK